MAVEIPQNEEISARGKNGGRKGVGQEQGTMDEDSQEQGTMVRGKREKILNGPTGYKRFEDEDGAEL